MQAGEADHTLHLCRHLAAQGLDVHLLTTRREQTASALPFKIYPTIRNWSWQDLPRLALCLKRCSPDVVFLFYIGWVYNYHPMITFAPTISRALLPHVPFITQFANAIGANPEQSSPVARAIRKAVAWWAGRSGLDYRYGTLLRDSDRIIVFSDLHRAILSRHNSDVDHKSVLIPPPPILCIASEDKGAVRNKGREALGLGDDDFLIAYLGFIYPGKGIETLLKAFQIVSNEKGNLRLVVVGGTLQGFSSFAEQVYEFSKQMRIDDKVIWTGGYSWDSDKASTYLRAADAFILPIDIGVQMNNSSFAAAATHGLPIIATRGAELERQFVHKENLFLCPPGDPEAMAAAIKLLMSAPDLRASIGAGALRLAQEWFSWDVVIERTMATLNDAKRS
jgi:glycosyltransferase involved in cell wall biosynthesis